MPARLKLIVAYDGAPFAGWQSQAHRNTIQDHLEAAFSRIASSPLQVVGAGRTDAGVHALGQCAHVDVPDQKLTAGEWTNAVNSELPPQIRVASSTYVSPSFHARFSAKNKTYRYHFWNGAILPPLEFARCWHVSAPLDSTAMDEAAGRFVGRHDFAAFAANRGKRHAETVRTISVAQVRRRGRRVIFTVTGDGFLYRMVRLMTGLLVRIGRGDADPVEVTEQLAVPTLTRRFAAPAAGLILVRVRY